MLLSAVDPNILKFISLGVIILGLGSLLRYFRQPYIIAYIIAGVLMGEHGFQLFTDKALIANFGEFGLILLLFFIGMETSLHGLIKNWKVATVGTVLQVMGSILMVGLIGWYFSWEMKRIIVMGFVTSLSSSAVVIKLLQDNHETQTATGKNVISMLLVQDILIVPMLIITNYLGGITPTPVEIGLQLMGGVLIISGIIWIVSRETITLPFSEQFKEDHELQVFLALIFCFGGAVLTALFGLSAALGAFVGGLIIRAANSTEWFHDSLHSFRVIFVALFFVSIGMLIDLHFLVENLTIVSFLILSVYIGNHFINTLVLHYFGRKWSNSIYGGALLAQIGELSFVLAASAFSNHIIADYTYQMTIIVIALTLLISPFWIEGTKRIVNRDRKVLPQV